MNIKQKKLLIIVLAFCMLATVLIPVTINQRGKAASWTSGPINSCYKVNASSDLVIKTSASASSGTVATIPKGTMIFVLNINSSGTWGYTGYNGKYGYVNLSGATRKDSGPATAEELLQRMQAVMQFYPENSVWKGSKNNSSKGQYIANIGGTGPSTCFGFAAEVWRALFGTEMAQAFKTSQMYVLSSDPDMTLIGTITNCDATKVKNLISKARCGDVIQSSLYRASGQHTMMVYSVDDSGAWIYDANRGGGNKVKLEYFTWGRLASERTAGMSLYTSAEYPPDAKAVIMGSGITLKNASGAVSTSYMVSDRINMSATVSNATSIVFHIINKSNGAIVYKSSSLTKASHSYAFTALNNNSTSYQIYYVAKNDRNTFTSPKIDITVKMPTVSVSNNKATIETNQSVSLGGRVTKTPSSAKLSWITSDHTIATVDASGKVTGRKAGTVTITVTVAYTGTSGSIARSSATFTITVLNPKFTVSFNVNGGTGSFSPITVEKTKQYGTLPEPTRSGYTFDGWYTAASGGTKITATSTVSINSNATLYAHWKANTYTANLDGNGGDPTKPSVTVTYDAAMSNLPVAIRPGYVFEGWFTSATGGTKVTTTTIYKTLGDSKYYAQWSLATFTVTLDAVGGEVSPKSVKVTYTKLFGELPTPTRVGYTFGGWFTEKGGKGTEVVSTTVVEITSNTSIYAYWIGNKYTVSFDSNGSKDTFDSKEVIFGSPYANLPIPEIPGYSFVGWYTEKEGGQLVNVSTNVFIPSDHILYAHWEPGKFTVSFEGNGGVSPIENKIVVYMTTYGELPTPTREGYTFIGWFDSLRPDARRITDSTTVTIIANQKLYANWAVNTYSVGFVTNCPDSFDPKKVEFDTQYGTLPVPTKKGYTFLGWFTPEADGGKLITENSVLKIGRNFSLEAHWQANTYTITFDPSSGTVDVESKDVVFDAAYGGLPTPERFGYDFMGWYTQQKGGEHIEETTIVSYDTDITIFAHWSARKIMVTFHPNGGTCEVEYDGFDFDLPFGKLPIPEKRGYAFMGWKKDDGEILTNDRVIDFVYDIEVVAQWQANDYSIKLDANGGSFANQDLVTLEYTVTYDKTYPMLATPSKHGYRFVGWLTVEGDHAYTGDVVNIISNQTFVADWAPLVHIIELDANGGSLEQSTAKAYYGLAYGKLPVPVLKGYVFTGWVNESGVPVTESTVVKTTADEKFTATWKERTYKLSFDANGGILEGNPTINVSFGGEYGELPVPTRVGYKFARWEDANGNYIYTGNTVTVAEDVKYYAQWIPLVFDVSFDGKGSHMIVPPISVAYDSQYNVLPDIERNGYEFLGWFDTDSNLVTEDSVVKITDNITLVAHWQAVEYHITFKVNGGEYEIPDMDFTFDKMSSLPVPVKTGCIFLGWYTENGELFSEDTKLNPDSENSLKAGWALSEYSIRFNIQGKINNSFTKSVTYNDRIGMLQNAMVPGYDFLYWLDAKGNIITSESVYTDTCDIVLYAELLPKSFNVTFYAPDAEPEYTEKTVTNESVFGELPQTVKHGYVLIGWFTEDGTRVTEDSTVMLTGDTTLTARWARVESNTDGVFSNNSLLSTSCEIIGLVDLVLLGLALIRRKKNVKN
ncbi:MAG: hypothetical protein E7312_01800 [Clostridiales bacterium]|nr:hypothetical protein [Clostridiales bacterium]